MADVVIDKSFDGCVERFILDLDLIKDAMNLLGLGVTDEFTYKYGEIIASLKPKLDKLPTLEEQVSLLTAQVEDDDNNFADIYLALIEKGQNPVESDRSTYADSILAIKEQKLIYDLSYFFYNDTRSPDEYWEFVCSDVTSMNHMLDNATLTGGSTYEIDLTNCNSFEYLFNSTKHFFDSVNIIIKIGVKNTHLNKLMSGGTQMNNKSIGFNISFSEESDVSNLNDLTSTFTYTTYKDVDLSKLSMAKLKSLYGTFKGSVLVGECDFNVLDTSNTTSFNGCFEEFNRLFGISSIDISGWAFSENVDVRYMFRNSGLENIVLAEGIILKDVNAERMFSGCSKLKSLNIRFVDTKSVSKGYAFENCTLLENIESEPWDIYNELLWTFSECHSLKSLPVINMHYCTTANAEVLKGTFWDCSSLEEVTINMIEDDNPQLVRAVQTFSGCSSLRKISGDFRMDKIKSFNSIFSGCTSLETIEITGGFANDTSLNSSITLDISASPVFDISSFINSLSENISGYTRIIKLNSSVYDSLTEETIALATTKKYTLASA